MNEADYLRLLTRQAEQANDFLSNARKWDRERWVCQRFLEALNVPYRQEDFAAPGEQPPDVLFKGAGFEVFFVLDEGRRLNEEWREELTRRRQAVSLRQLIRRGDYTDHTSGLGQRHLQANLVILQKSWADEFLRFCALNPRACPLLDVSEPGSPHFARLGADIDVRSDLPRYRVHRRGQEPVEVSDIGTFWEADFVAFAIGCSFSFEQALLDAGIGLRHLELGRNVAMYRSSIATRPSGRLAGPTVVSMRPLKAAEAIRAIQVTSRFPMTHGAPLHLGDPALIGICDLARPDYGDPVPLAADEIPLFWACGVTPQAVLAEVQPELYISHAPGHMLVSDRLYDEL
ncbi:hypothetical protein CLM86_06850 [Pseudomonas aeruginosa]|nr:hypothetical protein CLM86_06850 [Pseudomonas aeruginosa]